MAELFERLEKTGAPLSSAIDQYLDVCAAIGNYPWLSFAGVSRTFFNRVASEISLATSYETKIKLAKATIGYTVNSSSPIPHVNSLPSEILTRIFYMAADTCRLKYDLGDSIPLSRYPDYLSHVCTRWRQVALDSPHLWTHVDLVRLSTPNHGFKPRAETFVSRAGSRLLDVHIYEQADCCTYDNQGMRDLIAIAAPRSRSLELVARSIPGFGQGTRPVNHFFDKCVPGVLTELNFTEQYNSNAHGAPSAHFIDSCDRPRLSPLLPPLNLTGERLDALLYPVTHLRLDSIYFPWTHQAYHGLVELRLLTNDDLHVVSITRLELMGILASSPRLRLLHSEIYIADEQVVDAAIAPVRLDDLEVLQLHSTDDENSHLVLSGIAPGPKPLRFSFAHGGEIDMDDCEEEWLIQSKDFFKRSNVLELRFKYVHWSPYVGPETLLEALPNLQVLVLESCYDSPYRDIPPASPFHPCLPHLDTIYIVDCTILVGKLAQMFKPLRAERIVFWRCGFLLNDGSTLQKTFGKIKAN